MEQAHKYLDCLEQERNAYFEQVKALNSLVEALQKRLLEAQQYGLTLEAELNTLDNDASPDYRIYFQQAPTGLLILDHHAILHDLNQVAAGFLGHSAEKLRGASLRSLLSSGSFSEFTRIFADLKNSDRSVARFHALQLKDRRQFSLELHFLDAPSGRKNLLIGALIGSEDARGIHSEYLGSLAMEQLREGVAITDAQGTILRVNNAFSEITGYSRDEVLGQNPRLLKSGRHDRTFYQKMWDQIIHHGWWQGEIWNRRKNGQIYPQWLQVSRIIEPATQKAYFVSTFSDISERKESQSKLDRLAHYDALTGLMNRHFIKLSIQNTIQRTMDTHRSGLMAVLFIDLDHFKLVNDQYGHHEGDLVLQEAAHRILANIRQSDLVGRIGGDEFLVVLSRLEQREDVEIIARKLIASISAPYQINENVHHIAATIGIACFPDDGDNIEDLMRRADAAMYRCKKNGRGQAAFFARKDEEDIVSQDKIKSLLRAAIKNPRKHIDVHYQPIFDCRDSSILSFEALLRIRDEENNVFPPGELIEFAENENFIRELGEKIFTAICEFVQENINLGLKTPPVAVNLSVQQLNLDSLFSTFCDIAQRFGLSINQFNFEVTETSAMQNVRTILHTINAFKAAGCKILLDDFGTGYASLSQLHMLPVDVVKIDRSFTEMIAEENTTHCDLIRAIDSMVRTLAIDVVVEGVETAQQLEWLRQHEIVKVQGYFLSKPLDKHTLRERYLS